MGIKYLVHPLQLNQLIFSRQVGYDLLPRFGQNIFMVFNPGLVGLPHGRRPIRYQFYFPSIFKKIMGNKITFI